MGKHKDATLNIRIDEEELRLAKERARHLGIPFSTAMRRLVRLFIKDPEVVSDEAEADDRADYSHEHAREQRRK